jgi:uncharacterized phage protein (TIGR02216 family)
VSDSFTSVAAHLAGLAGAMFGWRPHEFWRATPAELSTIVAAMCHPQAGVAPPDANMLKQLMEAFPDG